MEMVDQVFSGTAAAKSVATHAPGPWTVGKMNVLKVDGFPMNRIPISGGGYAIAAVWAGDARRQGQIMGLQEMHEANARLIAAAPDLYDALALVLDKVLSEYHVEGSYVRRQAEAALAKARGQ